MNRAKNTAKAVLLAYDNFLYAVWRSFEHLGKGDRKSQAYEPLLSIIVPTYNTDLDFLRDTIDSVKGQIYQNWELLLIDDCSPDANVRTVIKQYADGDTRIKYEFLKENHRISGATNVGIKMAKGEYVGLLDHDDIVYPDTLQEVVKAISRNPDAKFFYTDEDKIIGKKRTQPFFKPSWNLGLLHCVNYITHFSVIKKETLDEVGYEDSSYDGAQDWELFLRVGRNVSEQEIVHIPQILYSWRMHSQSTSVSLDAKPYVLAAQEKAVKDDLELRGVKDAHVTRNKRYPGQLEVSSDFRENGLYFRDLRRLIGLKRAVFVMLSSRMALSRHIYRTAFYDKII